MAIELINQMMTSGIDTLVEYLTAHVMLCLVPAFFLSGAFNALIPTSTIFNYMGDSGNNTKKGIAYMFAATSGLIIEVCSCTILPLFAGIWKKGAGFGPAIAFLFAGPGITLLSTPLTASVLGTRFAMIKLALSIVMAIAIGLAMELTFKDTIDPSSRSGFSMADEEPTERTTLHSVLFFSALTLIMIAGTAPIGLPLKLTLVGLFSVLTAYLGLRYYNRDELGSWMGETYEFVKMIFPVLLLGVFASGVMKPLIPETLIASLTGQNTILANAIAALFGTVAYFPTLVEVPVANMFMELGMHPGPLMSYLLVDPGVSLQTLLVVNTIIKPKKTAAYALYMLGFGVLAGYLYGIFLV
ncbi:permease [Candidatus Bathyarchaeota archaeon]|nr:permease [Candidatus Bathyarchaeota archaeon]MBT4319456.1 permease [Candidatus Bathyarchaeota archaeon]MBT7346032.1 permease [Candidatus Bathyarchaeota archaeon]MBT7913490.1 permease [Candidatus Bathyarchaeota archaeon]